MYLPDFDTAQRLDHFEAWSDVMHATVQAQLYPDSGAAWLSVAGGYAVYCGHKSPLSRVCGLGMAGPVDASDLDALETFYRDRNVEAYVRICPHADASLVRLLGDRGYTVKQFMNVYARPVDSLDVVGQPAPDLDIRVATPGEARQWFEVSGATGDWAEPDGVTFMVIRSVLKPGASLFLAWQEGQPIAGGGLEIHEGLAALMAAETLPAYRRRGIHTALIRARLAAAAEAGCDLAMVQTLPGAASQGNVVRAGFQVLYTTVEVIGPRL